MTKSVKRTRHRSRQRARPKTRRKTRQRVKRNRTKNYSKKRKNTRKKNYSKKVAQEGGMFGCFGKGKQVEEGEDAKDVFRRLITDGEKLPKDTTLQVFGERVLGERVFEGSSVILLNYKYGEPSVARYGSREYNVYSFELRQDREVTSFDIPGRALLELLDSSRIDHTYEIYGTHLGKIARYNFYNYELVGGATQGHRQLDVLQSDKINKGVDKNRMKEAKAAAKEVKAETNKAKKLGISPEKYQSGKKYFTGTPEDLRETGFTVGADESIEVQATVHDRNPPTASYVYRKGGSQPEPEHIPTQLIDASMEATPKSPQLPGFIVPTSLNVHDDDTMTRRLNESLEGWTKAQRIEGDDNLVTQRAKAQHLELVNKSQQKHAALQAARVANSRRHTHTTSTHRPPASEFVSR
jgi:hypothetical protein